ncbi:hypothetical protein [Thioalkalivibrio sp. AKL7]|uniref:SLOG cluster 4 domain-containing protein n=1 Tax=Thioalkalivibrio sp. AKL7 TaxID=1158155 RepID=UPI00037AAED0|nr:hypothetical protein [Thioalkalivibrio sp. AKL7]
MNDTPRRPIISVVGDARLSDDDPRIAIAYRTGRKLIDHGFAVMTGGMGGAMDAALRGGRESTNWSPGSCISLLPGSNSDAPQVSGAADIVIPTGLDHARNLVVAQSDAVIAIGGGAGTLSEIAFAWIHRRLLVAVRCEGWSGRLADAPIDSRTRYEDIPDDRVYGADDADEAVALVRRLRPNYTRRHRRIAG